MSYVEFFQRALGNATAQPYPHQVAVAARGLPDAFTAPTGTGKTEAAVLGHLYRRLEHSDLEVRRQTPRWLVLALPFRGLVEQTERRVRVWLENLGIADEVDLHVVMGGQGWDDRRWRMAPTRDAIFIGTVDMLLSRALNRGYADSRWSWPISFGLFNNGVQWVFDEVQQMELATVTSRQLQAFRESFGTALPTRSMWMSATLDTSLLSTVDAPHIDEHIDAIQIAEDSETLRQRTDATKHLAEIEVDSGSKRASSIAEHVLALHAAAVDRAGQGVLTLIVVNRVATAQEIATRIGKAVDAPPVELLHRRFRGADRTVRTEAALAPVDTTGPGRIIVSTQVLEAGIDLDATNLITELAPWSSLVQRTGRCNRAGLTDNAAVRWIDVSEKDAAPYDPIDLDQARTALRSLDDTTVTPVSLAQAGPAPRRRIHHVLRRRDLLELFDTSPDLSGDPLDVSQFIRDGDERDLFVAWRTDPQATMTSPDPAELCPVSIADAKKWTQGNRRQFWLADPLQGQWRVAAERELRPGQVVIAPSSSGGYDPAVGWMLQARGDVEPVDVPSDQGLGDDNGIDDDPASQIGVWYPLDRHLTDVDRVTGEFIDAVLPDLSDDHRQACRHAAALHDLGKAHTVWQTAALASSGEAPATVAGPVAKTPGRGRLRFERRYFRHELVSLVALRGHAASLLAETTEQDLCCYLVAAHHGRVRLAIRSVPGESTSDDEHVVLGVEHGSPLAEVATPLGLAPAGTLDLDTAVATWTRDALALRDRADLGPFRLALLEAIVRLADWEASDLITRSEPSR